eukprot:m.239447 g.239447  ORF g.239447 m.239447 type:complete len:56 (+) comp13937_c0_seq12:884-1051(+)
MFLENIPKYVAKAAKEAFVVKVKMMMMIMMMTVKTERQNYTPAKSSINNSHPSFR